MEKSVSSHSSSKTPETARPRGRPKQSSAHRSTVQGDIIRVARTLFAENGYEGVSMRRVAEQAGCAPSALYRYFPSKRALLRFIWEEVFADLAAHLHRSVSPSSPPLVRLRDLSLAYYHFWLERPEDFRAIFLIQDQADTEAAGYFAQTSAAVGELRIFSHAIEQARQEGSLPQNDPLLVRDILFSALQGALLNVITIPEYSWSEPHQLGSTTVEIVLRGLGAPADF
ncbi:MAG: AcrR family transcriptional regulator [Parvibaculaceae bacterium]|jgi:AcrR family transcriptional regulator